MSRKYVKLLIPLVCILVLSSCDTKSKKITDTQNTDETPNKSQVGEDTTYPDEKQDDMDQVIDNQDDQEFINETNNNTTLHFVDAWGEWHKVEINQNVKKHSYNFTNLKNDSSGISYEDGTYYTRKGIDVSHHQGKIDWEKVKSAGYDFAFIRIVYRGYGESGSLNLDREYKSNIVNAQKAGLDVGVYVFSQAINESEAKEEAQIVLDALKEYHIQLPIVFDPELIRDDEARTDDVNGEQFTKNTIVFCDIIKAAGYQPMIYSNMCWEAYLYDLEQLQEYPIWYADYEPIPQTPYDFEFWQYSEEGVVDGIKGQVDLNIQFIKK